MRKLFVTAAAVAALLSTGSFTTRSDAMALAKPAGLHTAIKTTKPVITVRWACHRGKGAHNFRHGRCNEMPRHHLRHTG
jgi:hypothetical protein